MCVLNTPCRAIHSIHQASYKDLHNSSADVTGPVRLYGRGELVLVYMLGDKSVWV